MNKLHFLALLVSVMVLSVYFAGSASAEEASVYDWLTKLNRAVFGVTGAQVAESTAAVASGGTGDLATSDGVVPVSDGGGGVSEVVKTSPCGSYGDVNGDGLVNETDASLVSQYLAKLIYLDENQLVRADVNADGKASISDSLLIAQYAAGIKTTFAVCQNKPDLVVSDIRVYPVSGIFEGTEVVFEVTIKNIGTAATKDYSFSYDYGEGGSTTTDYPLSIPAGGSRNEMVTHVYKAAGTYTVTFSVTTSDDSNVANNKGLKSVTVNKSAVVITCTESDGGLNYYTYGIASGVNEYGLVTTDDYDVCNGNQLAEKYCEDNIVKNMYYTCPNGCIDGACVKKEVPVCLDSDGGMNYYVKGSVYGIWPGTAGFETETDSCCTNCYSSPPTAVGSSDTLAEVYCNKENRIALDIHQCEVGCKDGACVETNSFSLSEGETKSYTLGGKDYEVTADYVSSAGVKLTVNGQITPYLAEGGSFVLSDGAKIGIVNIGVQDYAGGVRKVSFTLTASVEGNLYEGETKTYLLGGKNYKVIADYVGSSSVRFTVNGQLTPPLVVKDVNGEAWRVGTSAKKLEFSESLSAGSASAKQETIRNITTFITDDELPTLLADGTFRNSKGDYDYHQYIYFDSVNTQTTTAAASLTAIYAEDPDTDVTADYFYVKNSDRIARYSLEFTTSAESDVTLSTGSASTAGTYLWSFEGKDITLLGKTYSIVKARRTSSVGNSAELTLMGGSQKATLAEGESMTYTVGGKDYDVKLDFVGSTTAKFTVNGELTSSMQEGDAYTLSDKSLIGVKDILVQDFAGGVRSVEFYLGATKIFLKDTDIANIGIGSQSLEVGSTKIDDTKVTITGSDDNTTFKIDTIQINVTADDDLYVPAGGKLSAQLEKPGAFMDSWDIEYAGLDDVPAEKIQIKTSFSNQYYLEFIDGSSNKVNVPLAYTSGGTNLKLGDSTNALVITENTTIAKNDYFIVTDSSQNQGRRKTYAIRYKGASASGDSSPVIKFQVIGESGINELVYSAYVGDAITSNADAVLKLGEATYNVWNVTPDTSSDFSIVIDLNGNGIGDTVTTAQNLQTVDTAKLVNVTTKSGAQILIRPFPLSSSYLKLASAVPMTAVSISIQTPNADDYDNTAPTPVDFDVTASSGKVQFSENPWFHGDHNYLSPQGESNTNYAYTSMGAKVKWDNPSNDPDTLEIDYPTVQRLPLVYITAPGAEISTGEAEGGSFVLADGAKISVVDIGVQDYAGGVRWVQFTLSLSAKEKPVLPPFPPDESFAGTVQLSPGWNLIGTFLLDEASVETDCGNGNNVLAAYYYDPVRRKYVDMLASEEITEEKSKEDTRTVSSNTGGAGGGGGENSTETTTTPSSGGGGGSGGGGYLTTDKVNSFWIKVANSCSIDFELDEPYGWLSEVRWGNKKLARDWNFLSVVPDMVGKTLSDISGTCDVRRAYAWDFEDKKWAKIGVETDEFDNDSVGYGFAVNVADDCVLGPVKTKELPPELP